jgi:hypothetical protein
MVAGIFTISTIEDYCGSPVTFKSASASCGNLTTNPSFVPDSDNDGSDIVEELVCPNERETVLVISALA